MPFYLYLLLFVFFTPECLFQLLASDGDKVLLRKVTSASSGVYRCEVTTEDSYTPIIGEGVMNVSGEVFNDSTYLLQKLVLKPWRETKDTTVGKRVADILENNTSRCDMLY